MRFSLKRTMEALGGDDTRDRKRRNTASMFDPPRLVRPVLGRMREVLHERQAKRRDNGCLYARVIQRFWRTYGGLSARIVNNTEDSGHLGNVRCGGKDVVCPITQEAIPWRSVAKFVTEAGAVVAYTAPQLIEYLLSSGNFNCCLTRTPFRLSFVWRLSQKPVRGAERLLMVYADRQSILARAIEHDNAILAIESSCGVAMTEAMDIAADLDMSTARASIVLETETLPEWRHLVDDYMRLDHAHCRGMLVADREKLYRLGLSPEVDAHGLMAVIAEWVEDALSRCDRYQRTMQGGLLIRHNRVLAPTFVPTPFSSDISQRDVVMAINEIMGTFPR